MKPKGGILDWIERLGSRLPDPTLLFVWCLAIVTVLSETRGEFRWDREVRSAAVTGGLGEISGRARVG